MRAQLQALRMRTHRPSSKQQNNCRYQVAFGPPISLPTQPYAQQPSTPPDDAHTRVLQIVLHPRVSPAVFRKRIDATPSSDEYRIEELLAPSCPGEPPLTHQQQYRKYYAVSNKGTAHDEMGQTLPQMVVPTEPQRCDPSEKHLHPAHHRHGFPNNTVRQDHIPPYPRMDSPLKVELKVNAKDNLHNQHEHEGGGEGGVNVGCKLAATMRMAEEVPDDCEDGAEDLEWNVKSGSDNLWTEDLGMPW